MDLSSVLEPFGPLAKPLGTGEYAPFEEAATTSPASSQRTSCAAGSSFSDIPSMASTNPLRLLHDRLVAGELAAGDTDSDDSIVGPGAEDVADLTQVPTTRQGTSARRRPVHWMLRLERSRQDSGIGTGATPIIGRTSCGGGSWVRHSHWLIDGQVPGPDTHSSDKNIFEGTRTDVRLQSIIEGTGTDVRSVADAMLTS